jgi:hypothetical protein
MSPGLERLDLLDSPPLEPSISTSGMPLIVLSRREVFSVESHRLLSQLLFGILMTVPTLLEPMELSTSGELTVFALQSFKLTRRDASFLAWLFVTANFTLDLKTKLSRSLIQLT